MRRILLLIGFVTSMLGVGLPSVSLAQATAITPDQVVSACSVADNRDNCLALVDQYVAQVKASGDPLGAQTEQLNALVFALANVGAADPDLNDLDVLVADAIKRIAIDAPDVVNVAAVNGIAENVLSGDYISTAATTPPASPA